MHRETAKPKAWTTVPARRGSAILKEETFDVMRDRDPLMAIRNAFRTLVFS